MYADLLCPEQGEVDTFKKVIFILVPQTALKLPAVKSFVAPDLGAPKSKGYE